MSKEIVMSITGDRAGIFSCGYISPAASCFHTISRFSNSIRIDITVCQHGKCFIFLKCKTHEYVIVQTRLHISFGCVD